MIAKIPVETEILRRIFNSPVLSIKMQKELTVAQCKIEFERELKAIAKLEKIENRFRKQQRREENA